MRRREFITLLGGGAVAWPLTARAQERMRQLGVLLQYTEDNAEAQHWVAAFREGLQKAGRVEGRNLRIDYRWGGSDMNLLQRVAKEIAKSSRRTSRCFRHPVSPPTSIAASYWRRIVGGIPDVDHRLACERT